MPNKKVWLAVAVVLFCFLAFSGVASAVDTQIFSGGVLAGYGYAASGGEKFTISSVAPLDRVVVEIAGEGFGIENQSCSRSKSFEGCYDGAKFLRYNNTLDVPEVYEFTIKLSRLAPDIKVSKYAEKNSLEVGEETIVYVNVTNSGTASGSAYFSESVPSGFAIIELPDQPCELSGNSLLMNTEIVDGGVKHCNYKLRALAPGSYFLLSSVEFDAIKREKVEASFAVVVKDLVVSANATFPGQLSLGQKFNITFNISSKEYVSSFIFASLIPAAAKSSLISRDATATRGNGGLVMSYGDKLTSLNGSLDFLVGSEAVLVGVYSVLVNATWIHNGFSQSSSSAIPLNTTLPAPYFRLIKFDNTSGRVLADVVNPSNMEIFNVSAAFGGSDVFSSGSITSLGHGSFEFKPAAQSGNLTGAIKYYTVYGQELVEQGVLPLKVTEVASQPASPSLPRQEEARQAAEPGEVKEAAAESSEASTGDEVKKPKRKLSRSDIQKASMVAGIIIGILVAFFAVKARKSSQSDAL
ncbi:hypothetical protein HYU18_02190 [Candidatus Woesearchaeota archaeon]|nr:hypothetical protein [Candidatus Woesearchaeota archaeon]